MSNFPSLFDQIKRNDLLTDQLANKSINSAVGDQSKYIGGLNAFNPTSKDPGQTQQGFGIGFKIGNFSLGYASGGSLPQYGERVDYSAFLQQAGTILRNSRFMATIFFPNGNVSASRAGSYACEEVTINDQKIEATPYRMNMMPTIMAPYFRDFGGTVTLKFRMYISNTPEERRGFSLNIAGLNLGFPLNRNSGVQSYDIEPRKSLLRWQNEIVNFDGRFAGVNYFENYTSNSGIIVSSLDTGSNVLKNVEFTQVYPLEVGGINYSWQDQNTYMTQTVTFAFTRIIDSSYGNGFIPPEVKKAAFDNARQGVYSLLPLQADQNTQGIGVLAPDQYEYIQPNLVELPPPVPGPPVGSGVLLPPG